MKFPIIPSKPPKFPSDFKPTCYRCGKVCGNLKKLDKHLRNCRK